MMTDVERLRITLAKDVATWADMLGMKSADYLNCVRGGKDLSVLSLLLLANQLEFSLENLMNRKIDFKTVAAKHAGNNQYLSERYSVAAFSRRRTATNLLDAVEEFLGWEARARALRYLQVNEAVFRDPDETININFNTDLCEFLTRDNGGETLFFNMGAYSVISNQNTVFGRIMSQQRSLKELHQYVVEEMLSSYWERNCKYSLLSLTSTSCQIESIATEELSSGLGIKNPGNAMLCATRNGIAASIPGYLGLPFSNAREIRCVHRGDPACVFETDFELGVFRQAKNNGTHQPQATH